MVDTATMALLSGETEYKNKSVRMSFDELKLNKEGDFLLTKYTQQKDGDGLFPQENKGEQADIIVLKLRRRMVEFNMAGGFERGSNEYNTAAQEVVLSTGERGTEKELKKTFPNMKVQIIIYALLDGEVVKIPVSGSSLYTDDPEKPMRLYNYLQSFNDGEHVFEYITHMTVSSEEYDTGKEKKLYYAIGFRRGEKLPQALFENAGNKLTDLVGDLDDFDKKYGASFPMKKEKEDQMKKVEYPEAEDEGIRPEDIPF